MTRLVERAEDKSALFHDREYVDCNHDIVRCSCNAASFTPAGEVIEKARITEYGHHTLDVDGQAERPDRLLHFGGVNLTISSSESGLVLHQTVIDL